MMKIFQLAIDYNLIDKVNHQRIDGIIYRFAGSKSECRKKIGWFLTKSEVTSIGDIEINSLRIEPL